MKPIAEKSSSDGVKKVRDAESDEESKGAGEVEQRAAKAVDKLDLD